jgi:hypothetical protein
VAIRLRRRYPPTLTLPSVDLDQARDAFFEGSRSKELSSFCRAANIRLRSLSWEMRRSYKSLTELAQIDNWHPQLD